MFDRYFAYPIGAPMNHLAEHIMNVPQPIASSVMGGCFVGCFYYYTDSCFRRDCTMNHLAEHIMNVPAHKQTDPAKYPGQIVNPIPDAKTYKPAHGGYPGKVTR